MQTSVAWRLFLWLYKKSSFTELIKLRILAWFLSRKLKQYAILARDKK